RWAQRCDNTNPSGRIFILHLVLVYTEMDFDQEETKAKLLGFPGGSIDLSKQESGIAVLKINNPSHMNAFTGTMMVQLEEKVSLLEEWADGKGLILQGAAGTFCSGLDLNAFKQLSKPQAASDLRCPCGRESSGWRRRTYHCL
uniref:Ethylmalonyl-CoA decarboxylase 1 n=1 Tax=Hippocampus comes TaxID=109280 RepID=A0A3Q2Y9Z7_HIPCM